MRKVSIAELVCIARLEGSYAGCGECSVCAALTRC